MNSSWIVWSLVILIASSTFNILNGYPDKAIKADPITTSLWSRCVIIIAGIFSFISFFIPNIGMTEKHFKIIKDNIDIPLTIFAGFVMTTLFTSFPIALKSAGAVAVAIMNLNFAVQLIYNILFKGVKPSQMEIFGTIGFVASVVFLAYEKSKSK